MTRITGISGSLRRDSFNTALLRSATVMMPDDSTLAIRLIHDIPVETAQGIPSSVTHLKDEIAASSGLLVATPGEVLNNLSGE